MIVLIVKLFVAAGAFHMSAAAKPYLNAVHAQADHSSHGMPIEDHEQGSRECQISCAVQAGANGTSIAPPESAYPQTAEMLSSQRSRTGEELPRSRMTALDPPPPRG